MHSVNLLKTSALLAAVLLLLSAPALSTGRALADNGHIRPLCSENSPLCTEVVDSLNYEGYYTGHDEPSLLFYSSVAGSGNSNLYRLTLPLDPPNPPKQDGTGGTFNFQLHPAFWFGMAMCDDQSAPNPGGSPLAGPNAPCTPDSDSNIFTGSVPGTPNYIGKHPGTAFMEMQFYPPGWVLWPPGNSCDPAKWCAALNIDSLSENLNLANPVNNNACRSIAGDEPVNFAFITKSGKSIAPANPVDATNQTFTPDPSGVMMFESGDVLQVDMHDTAAGFTVIINDMTKGTSGSMTASVANGFGKVVWAPTATTCSVQHSAFHPEYATSSEDTRVVWAAHSYNVAFSDEIGHFEFCNAVSGQGGHCTQDGVGDLDKTRTGADDDVACFAPPFMPPFQSTRVKVGGCFGTDADFDGVVYQKVWPGSTTNLALEAAMHPTSLLFTSPQFNGSQNFSRLAFEADLPRIETNTIPSCNRSTGANCVNPPVLANFYPIYSTATISGHCTWQLGGAHIPGTTNTFGGTSTAEYGPLLLLTYPGPAGPFTRFNNFRNVMGSNPCAF